MTQLSQPHLHQALIEDLLGALITVTPEGTVLSWNAMAETLFGYTEAEAVGCSIFDTIVPPDLVEEKREWLRAAAKAGPAAYESIRRRKDGRQVYVEVAVRAVRDSDGNDILLLNERNITRIKDQRDALAFDARLLGVLEVVPDAIVVVDRIGQIALVNPQAERLLGYSRQELLGQSVELLVPERFRGKHPGRGAGYFTDPRPQPMISGQELSARRKDGTEFPVEISLSPLTVDGGTLTIAALRDISERLRLEEIRREVGERKLAQEALALEAAEVARSNAELEQFAYVASHDLQEPLRVVATYTRLLARRYQGKLDADVDEFIANAVDGVTRMQQLISDLLSYSRVGTEVRPSAPVDCEAVLLRVLAQLRPSLEQSGAVVTYEALPTVMVNDSQVMQLFQNLLGNAVKFRGKAPPRVHLSAEPGEGHWRFAVQDNGIGIAPEDSARVFVMFQRLHTTAEYPGAGMGLAICRKIVERHGGRIWLESAMGQGATFRFTLPATPDSRPGVAMTFTAHERAADLLPPSVSR
jgi:PAS domain S-box-containing protein